jgi:hypothetical protein
MLGSQQGEHCPPAPPKSIKRQATAGVTWRRFVPGRWLPDRATPLPPPSIGPLRRQELTGAWRVMKTAGRPPCPRAQSVIQGVVERRLRSYLFCSLAFRHVLQAKTFGISANYALAAATGKHQVSRHPFPPLAPYSHRANRARRPRRR